MNRLERASHDIVLGPVAEPPSIAELESRGRGYRRRRDGARILVVAACVTVMVAGIVGVTAVRHSGDGSDLRTGSSIDLAGPPTEFDLTWSYAGVKRSGEGPVFDDLVVGLVRDRLTAFGATDVSVGPATGSSPADRRLAVSARGISLQDASLLLVTRGVLSDGWFMHAASVDYCPLSSSGTSLLPVRPPGTSASVGMAGSGGDPIASYRSVGWPISKPTDTCYTTTRPLFQLSNVVVPPARFGWVLKVEEHGEGKFSAVQITTEPNSRDCCPSPNPPLCGILLPDDCSGVLLDGQLIREPDVVARVPPGEKPAVEGTPDGFIIRGFTDTDARIFAAVVKSGAHDLNISLTAKQASAGATTGPISGTTVVPRTAGTVDASADNLVVAFVAATDIPIGTSGSNALEKGLIKAAKIRREFVPSTAIQSTDAVYHRNALFTIAAGTVIVDGMFI